MATKHSNLLVEDSIKSVKERLKTTLGNIKFQDGQVFWDDIEKLEHCIMALENLENEEDEEESMYKLTEGEEQEYAYYTAYWEEE
jgi:hypothetical protein|tara:strand:- start:1371 stop:1625 length:255 start_codon:yes stop_codon:yes gene_type:complete